MTPALMCLRYQREQMAAQLDKINPLKMTLRGVLFIAIWVIRVHKDTLIYKQTLIKASTYTKTGD